MKGAKTLGDNRKKVQDKYSHYMNVFRMDKRKPRPNSVSNDTEQKENIPSFGSISNHTTQYLSHCPQDMLCFQSLVAMTPPSLFIPLGGGPATQAVQTPYNISPLSPIQGHTCPGNPDHANNYPPNNLTNFVSYQTEHRRHQSHPNVFDLSSFFDESYFNPIPESVNNLVSPSPPFPVSTPLHNVVSSTKKSYNMPSRPNPPSFTEGPQYYRASAEFLAYFGKADVDNSQFITLDELKAFLQNKDGSSFNDATAMTIMNMFDKNKDYMIDADEFPEMLAYINNWYSCFAFLDSDNSGTINFLEMHNAITCLGLVGLSDAFTANLLEKYVCAGGHEIRFDNFILACVTLCRFNETYKFLESQFGTPGRLPQKLEQFLSLAI